MSDQVGTNTMNPPISLAYLPNECILEIFRHICDIKTLTCIRLLNRRLSRLVTPIVFESVDFQGDRMKSFSQHLFKHVKRMKFNRATSPYEVALALNKRAHSLKRVDLMLKSDLVVLEELVKCVNLEEMCLTIWHVIQDGFDSLLAQVLGGEQKIIGWKNMINLELAYDGYGRLNLNNTLELFPKLQGLKLRNFREVEAMPETITKLDLRFDPIMNTFDDSGLFIRTLENLPALQEFNLITRVEIFTLPQDPCMTLTDLCVDVNVPTADDDTLILASWCSTFPRLRRLHLQLWEEDDNESDFIVGDIQPDTVLQLSIFKLKFLSGPRIWKIIQGLPNITELVLDYTYWPIAGANDVVPPLGDLSKLVHLSIGATVFGETNNDLTWLRESIWSSFHNAVEKKMVLHFNSIDMMDVGGVLRLWGAVSEVIHTLSVEVRTLFDPAWFAVLSHNLKVFRLLFLDGIEAAIAEKEIRVNKWINVIASLRRKGIGIEGDLLRFVQS